MKKIMFFQVKKAFKDCCVESPSGETSSPDNNVAEPLEAVSVFQVNYQEKEN